MSNVVVAELTAEDLSVSPSAQAKMAELVGQLNETIEGIRIYATPGGCSGISFGMTFSDQVGEGDSRLACDGFSLLVDADTLPYLRGVEIDYRSDGSGNGSFIFNNLQPVGSACGSCGSAQGGGCA